MYKILTDICPEVRNSYNPEANFSDCCEEFDYESRKLSLAFCELGGIGEPGVGIGPTTSFLPRMRSTTELPRRIPRDFNRFLEAFDESFPGNNFT